MIESQDQDDDHPNLIIITQREDGSEGFALQFAPLTEDFGISIISISISISISMINITNIIEYIISGRTAQRASPRSLLLSLKTSATWQTSSARPPSGNFNFNTTSPF